MSQISASKQKRLAAKAARNAAKGIKSGESTPATSGKSTPALSSSMNSSTDDLTLEKLNLKVDRTATGVYTSQERSRDLKIESYSLNYHGRVLIDNATIELNFGRRYGLIGANGSGKSTFLQSLASKDIEIPNHFDVSMSSLTSNPCRLLPTSRSVAEST
jgi:ATP-binding cassette subfamily F protein 2